MHLRQKQSFLHQTPVSQTILVDLHQTSWTYCKSSQEIMPSGETITGIVQMQTKWKMSPALNPFGLQKGHLKKELVNHFIRLTESASLSTLGPGDIVFHYNTGRTR